MNIETDIEKSVQRLPEENREDAIQEIWLKICEKKTFDSGFVWKVAQNYVTDVIRKIARDASRVIPTEQDVEYELPIENLDIPIVMSEIRQQVGISAVTYLLLTTEGHADCDIAQEGMLPDLKGRSPNSLCKWRKLTLPKVQRVYSSVMG